MELLNNNSESPSQTPENNDWSNFPPFRGDKSVEKSTDQDESSSEIIENAPDYLSDIDPARRKEIIDTSAEMAEKINTEEQVAELKEASAEIK